MMAGDLVAAEEMFARVASQGTPLAETLTGRNRSLLLFARRKFREAQEDLQVRPGATGALLPPASPSPSSR